MKTSALWLSASALTLIWCGAAQAQAPAPNGEDMAVETVVVTGERRTENLMTTAISASVLSASDLSSRDVFKVDDLQFIAPNVTIDNFGQGIDFNIRGIGKGEHNSQTMAGVITYRDGAATFPGYFTEEPYFDIASVEVLRGPQGTFVGQNATGGAVFVTTANPEIGGGYDGYAQASFGNYTDTALQGALNIPLSDTLAMRVSAFGDSRESFYDITDGGSPPHPAAGNDRHLNWGAGRVSLLWKPTEALSVLWKTDADYLDNGGYPADIFTDGCKFISLAGCATATTGIVNPGYTDNFHFALNAKNTGMDRFVRSILKIDYVLPDGITLRSVSSYQNGNSNYATDLDGTSLLNYTFFDRTGETIYSQEFNVISPDNQRVTWVVGAFTQSDRYAYEKPYQFDIGAPPGVLDYQLQGSTPNTSWAVFGQVGVFLWDGFQAQLGGRWSSNRQTNDVQVLAYGFPVPDNQTAKSYSLDYKAALNWTVDGNNFVYAFVSTGYKPGGLNIPQLGYGYLAPFGPERVTSYETGWKSTMFDGHVRNQLDVYYNQYKGFQVSIAFPDNPVFGDEINAPNTTKTYGVELETDATFGAFSMGAGFGYSHSEFGTFYAVDARSGGTLGACNPSTGPVTPLCVNVGGHPATYAPDVTGNVSVQYAITVGTGDTLTPRLNYAYVAPQWATMFDNPALGDRIGVRNLLGGQLEWKHDTYVLTLYGTNLTDLHYETALVSGIRMAGPPRQFGIRLFKAF